jgi:putative lipase involved disintegration of autophagic bodies
VAVFRGSDNFANFATDVRFFTSEYDADKTCERCNVHRGFYNSYNRLVNKGFKEAINKAFDTNPKYSVIFTGHSLGGAVANLAAVAFKK